MTNKRPIVAITGPEKGGFPAWMFTWLAVWRAGGKAVRVRPSKNNDISFHALIIGGGADINPELYGQSQTDEIKEIAEKSSKSILKRIGYLFLSIFIFLFRKLLSPGHTAPVDKKRDDLEQSLLKSAISEKKPVLGICRGAQLINIHFGGNLYQDISDFYGEIPKVESIYPKKEVEIIEGTQLAAIAGKSSLKVNSLHNQAVDEVCDQINVAAKEKTGIVQAIEHKDYPFMIGVQWHPEYLPQMKEHQLIFKALIKSAMEQFNK